MSSYIKSNCNDTNENGALIFGNDECIDLGFETICFFGTLEFTADSTFIQKITSLRIDLMGNQTSELECALGSYEFIENSLILCLDNDCVPGTISLTDTEMLWRESSSDDCILNIEAFK